MPKPYAILALLLIAIAGFVASRPRSDHGPTPVAQRPQSTADSVVRVVDGDTVVLRSAGKSRLIGVDTPEVFGTRECFGAQASAFAKRILRAGLHVRVGRGAQRRDRYGRSLIYLSLPDGRSFNELLVADGFARPLAIAPNTRFAARFERLAGTARKRRAGLWSPAACDGR